MSTELKTRRRRTAAELANRPTKQLLKDRAFLAGKRRSAGLSADEAADLQAIERELRGRTGGVKE